MREQHETLSLLVSAEGCTLVNLSLVVEYASLPLYRTESVVARKDCSGRNEAVSGDVHEWHTAVQVLFSPNFATVECDCVIELQLQPRKYIIKHCIDMRFICSHLLCKFVVRSLLFVRNYVSIRLTGTLRRGICLEDSFRINSLLIAI